MPYGHNNTTLRRIGWDVKESKIGPAPSNQGRVDFDPSKFDLLLQQKGVIVKIYRSTYCPNVKSVDGAEHEIDCELCNGFGFLDVDPICIKALIQAQELDKLPQIEGLVDGNTVLMTFPIGVEMQYFTKIVLHDFTDIYFQRVMRKPGSLTDVLKYSACRVNVLIDKNGRRYYQDRDFALDHNGNIKWLTPGDQQLVAFSAVPDAGTFMITWGGHTTTAIQWNASVNDIQSALRALPGLENVVVSIPSASSFLITYSDVDSPVALATSTSSLTSSSNPVTIQITNNTPKPRKPNNGLPYTIHYEAMAQYRAVAASHVSRFTQIPSGDQVEYIKMPEQWYCKKEFFPKRNDKFSNATIDQGPYDTQTEPVIEQGGDASGSGTFSDPDSE